MYGIIMFSEHAVPRRTRARDLPFFVLCIDDRRERQIFQLADGRRSIARIAEMLHLLPNEVAQRVQQLRERGYVELLPSGSSERG